MGQESDNKAQSEFQKCMLAELIRRHDEAERLSAAAVDREGDALKSRNFEKYCDGGRGEAKTRKPYGYGDVQR